jgi:hypothetical protein
MLWAMRAWTPDEWARVRARGKADFLLRNGVLRRGVPLGAVVAVALEVALGSTFPEALWGPLFLLRFFLLSAVFSLSGCLRANVSWNLQEKRHAEQG